MSNPAFDDVMNRLESRQVCPSLHEAHVLLDEIYRVSRMNNWQPIETAPKDGTRVMVWCVADQEEPECLVAEYRHERVLGRKRGTLCWIVPYSYQDEQGGEECVSPTHWLPLPKPPTNERE